MKIKEITDYLESIAPVQYQESYDNAGLIIGDPEKEVNRALVCLDSTEAVIDEAIRKGCQLVIAHHPIIFGGLKKITGKNYVERTVIKAIKYDIAIYAIHTNLDNIMAGVNAKIAEKLELKDTQILSPKDVQTEQIGAGMIGTLRKTMDEMAFLKFVKEKMQADCIRHTQTLGKKIEKVAVCGGSGSFLLEEAIRQKADVFITGDFKYHQFFDADGKIIIADIGHYESEQFTPELLHELLSKKFRTFAVLFSDTKTNPIKYL